MLEKFAHAFLAGMPSVVKPASQTAYLTELTVRRMVESELLPEGSLALLCGGPGDLLDHLTAQDTLGFTGSAATALALRTHPVAAGRAVRFNAEADSLNCSILGPGRDRGRPGVQPVRGPAGHRDDREGRAEVPQAIRRALVPAGLLAGAVADAVAARLADVVVGNPADPGVQILGALASLGQREEVRQAVAEAAVRQPGRCSATPPR